MQVSRGSWEQAKFVHGRRQSFLPSPSTAQSEPGGHEVRAQSMVHMPLDPKSAHEPLAHRSSRRFPALSRHGLPTSAGKLAKQPWSHALPSRPGGSVRQLKPAAQSASFAHPRRHVGACQADAWPTGGVAVSRPAHTCVSLQMPDWQDEAHSPCDGPVLHGEPVEQRQNRP